MTNQNTTLREPEREPDRLRPHSQPSKTTCESPVDAALTGPSSSSSSSSSSVAGVSSSVTSAVAAALAAGASSSATTANSATHSSATTTSSASTAIAATTSNSTGERCSTTAPSGTAASTAATLKREASEGCSSPPLKRSLQSKAAESPVPLDLYQRRPAEVDIASDIAGSERARSHTTVTTDATHSTSNNQSNRCSTPADLSGGGIGTPSNNNGDDRDFHSPDGDHPDRPPSVSLRHVRPGSIALDPDDDIAKYEDLDDYDEEMDDDDADNSSAEMGLNMKKIAAIVAANAAAGHSSAAAAAAAAAAVMSLPPHSPLSGGIGGGGGDADSARSTPAALPSITSTAADLTQRPASRTALRDERITPHGGGSLDRPSSSGTIVGYTLPTTSAHVTVSISGGGGGGCVGVGDLSPNSATSATGVGSSGEPIAGTSGLGPVQSVPLVSDFELFLAKGTFFCY